jgi:circadian clock protein KaiC
MSVVDKLTTGVPGFDIITHGGIPKGRTTLIVGRSGTGKTIVGLQLVSHLVRAHGLKAVVLAVEESPDDLTTTGDLLGLGLSDLVRSGALHIADVTRPIEGPTIVSGDYDVFGLIHRVEAIAHRIGADVVVLDSATALFSPRPPDHLLRSHFFQLIGAFRRMNLTAIVMAESPHDYGQLTTLGVEDFVCDLVLIARNIVDGERRRRSIEVHKYRRSAHFKGEFPFTITTRGVAVFPLDVQERPEPERIERYSSGVAGLDEMTRGGWLRNAIVIVRGPTGSGKTMLAGLYSQAGVRRGERVMYYGFEEPRPTLLRNWDQIGMDMSAAALSGNLRVKCRYPEAVSLEDLLIDLRLGLEEFAPSLIVLDSISSIEHASSEKAFRQFMIGMAAILRDHGRSALITQTVIAGEAEKHTAPYLSTIADAILSMDYSPQGFELNRTMRVVKMRGSGHETHPYRLSIEPGGLKVERIASSPPPTA